MREFIVFASDPLDGGFTEEDVRERIRKYKIPEPTEEDVWQELAYIRKTSSTKFNAEVRAADKRYTGIWRVEGTLGLWNGPRKVQAEFQSLRRAIEACFHNMDEVSVTEDGRGKVTIKAYHHDGTNVFTLYRLKDRKRRNARLRELFGWR